MKSFSLALAVMLCLVLFVAPQASTASAPKDNWTSVRSKNFFLVGNASEKEIRQAATRLEQFRYVFSRLFTKLQFNSPIPTTVIVFKSDSAYKPFKSRPDDAGYFQPGEDVNYITLTAERRDGDSSFRTIFHEYVHLLLNNTLGRTVPLWFNEGLAEYYSTFSITDEDRQAVLGEIIPNHVLYLRQQKMLPLRSLFAVDYKSPHYNEGDKRGVFYAESWMLVHYLIQGNKGQHRQHLGAFVNLLRAGKPVEEAFPQAFQMSIDELEKDFKSYVQGARYTATAATFPQRLEFDSEMQAAPVSEAEAQAYLGDLLLHTHRLSDAEARLQQAIAMEPGLAMAHASLGMLRMHQGRFDQARQSLERAVAANAPNYLVHYYYALALSQLAPGEQRLITSYPPDDVTKMRAELKRAIELNPDFPESYHLLAFVNLVTNEQIDESIAMLKKALSVSPGKQEYSFVLAQLYMHKRDFKAAREILEPLARNGSDPDISVHAQGLLDSLKSMEEFEARFKAQKQGGEETDGSESADGETAPHLRARSNSPARETVIPAGQPFDQRAAMLQAVREVLRKPGAGEEHRRALLVSIDCGPKAVVLDFKAGDLALKLRTADFTHVEFRAYAVEMGSEISCGKRNPANDVVVTYRPGKDPRTRTDGEVVAVEFVPKEFELEKQ